MVNDDNQCNANCEPVRGPGRVNKRRIFKNRLQLQRGFLEDVQELEEGSGTNRGDWILQQTFKAPITIVATIVYTPDHIVFSKYLRQ